jgi:hypothetical protein
MSLHVDALVRHAGAMHDHLIDHSGRLQRAAATFVREMEVRATACESGCVFVRAQLCGMQTKRDLQGMGSISRVADTSRAVSRVRSETC